MDLNINFSEEQNIDDVSHEKEEGDRPVAFDAVLAVLLTLCLVLPLVRMRGFLRVILAFKATFITLGTGVVFIERVGLLETNFDHDLELRRDVEINETYLQSYFTQCFEEITDILGSDIIFEVENQNPPFDDDDEFHEFDNDGFQTEKAYEYDPEDRPDENIKAAITDYVEECYQQYLNHHLNSSLKEMKTVPVFTSGLAIDHWVSVFLFHMEEGMTMILFYELFARSCWIQVRVFEWIPLLKKIGGVALAGILAQACQAALMKGLEATVGNSSPLVVQSSSPFVMFLTTLHTCCDAYMLFRILLALKANGRFREQRGRGDASSAIVGLVVVFFLGQVYRLAMVVTDCVTLAIGHMDFWRCLAKNRMGDEDILGEDIPGECEKMEEQSVAIAYLLTVYGAVFEYGYLSFQIVIAYVRRRREADGEGPQ